MYSSVCDVIFERYRIYIYIYILAIRYIIIILTKLVPMSICSAYLNKNIELCFCKVCMFRIKNDFSVAIATMQPCIASYALCKIPICLLVRVIICFSVNIYKRFTVMFFITCRVAASVKDEEIKDDGVSISANN